jgi:Ca2+-transporting ATPase
VAFATLVVANLGLVFVNLSWSQPLLAALRAPNPALWWVTAGTLALLGAILYVPLLRSLFGFSLLPGLDLLACLGAGVLSIAWFELLKRLAPRRTVALGRVK